MTTAKHEPKNESTQKPSRIPTFTSIDEEAEFWDTHSITDYLDELEEVTDVKFVVRRTGDRPLRKSA